MIKKNISLFMGRNFHYVIYPVNNDNEAFNFIGVLKYKLTANELDNYGLFKEEGFIQSVKDKLQNKISANILDNLNNIKCFPVFVSKGYLKPGNNIFLIGAQFYKAISATNSIIENNILPFYAFNYVNNCNIRNNINSSNGISGTNIRSGNFSGNIDLTTIFINYTTVAEAIDFTANFRLLEDSEYKESGTDNSDIGIYGGRFPWKDGSIPFNPNIVSKEISGTTDENGNLNIKIEVQAQKN